jgi:4-hydroxyproline epimerase
VVRTLAHLGRSTGADVRIDTPAGLVRAKLESDGGVTIENVPSFRHAADVQLDVPGVGRVRGDVAYGGNWFFLTEIASPTIAPANVAPLLAATTAIREALRRAAVTGAEGAEIDHVELFGASARFDADSRNFVLCPGGAYDRSPCGTGTSAKMAALHARGTLALEQRWVQESITGSVFTGWLTERDGALVPHIRGRAFVTSEATLRFDASDPFRGGWQAR